LSLENRLKLDGCFCTNSERKVEVFSSKTRFFIRFSETVPLGEQKTSEISTLNGRFSGFDASLLKLS
jgi:hypothetical protein